MNNLLQSLRGVLSALIGFQSPEDGLLEKARRRWNCLLYTSDAADEL